MFSKTGLKRVRSLPTWMRTGEKPWSLATRLTAWYAASAFTLLLMATGYLYWALVTNFDREDDETLVDEIQILRKLLRDQPENASEIQEEVAGEWDARQYARIYSRILNEDGHTEIETPGMNERFAPNTFPLPVAAGVTPGRGSDIRALTGPIFRALAAEATVGLSHQSTRIIQVALERTYEKSLLAVYRRRMWLVLGFALLLCILGGDQIARRGIRPVAEITGTAQRIRSSTLHERIETHGLPAELATLAGTFNEMLDRLATSFARLSQFSADIAHELRTPINNIRGEAEVALGKSRSPEEYREVLGSCLEECGRLGRLIDSLLFLARAESPETQITKEPVDVGQELRLVRDFYEAAAAEAKITLAVETTETVKLDVARTLFHRAIGNLVANALNHTPPEGLVTMTMIKNDAAVHITVSDTGCGIPAINLPYLFDRFYRVDRARSSASGGAGLGLAIVKSIVTLHGGSVEIGSEVGHGTQVTLVLPCRMTHS